MKHLLACYQAQLIGGVARQEPGGTRIRGEVHMLLVGDPGTGEDTCHWFRGPRRMMSAPSSCAPLNSSREGRAS